MSTYVPRDVQDGLDKARLKAKRKASRYRIETDAGYFRVLDLWETGFSVAATDAPKLRGYVDLFEGPTQLFQCLIIASEEVGGTGPAGEVHYEFKRMTAVTTAAARDFAAPQPAPSGLLISQAESE